MPASPHLLQIQPYPAPPRISTLPDMDNPNRNSFENDSLDEVRERLDHIFQSGSIPTPPNNSSAPQSPRREIAMLLHGGLKESDDGQASTKDASGDFEKVYSDFLRETSRTELSSPSSRHGPAPTKPPLRPLPSVPPHDAEILPLDDLPSLALPTSQNPTARRNGTVMAAHGGKEEKITGWEQPRPGTSASTAYSEAEKRTWRISSARHGEDPSNLTTDEFSNIFGSVSPRRNQSGSDENSSYNNGRAPEQPTRRGPLLLSQPTSSSTDRERKLAQLRAQQLALQQEQKRLEEQQAAHEEQVRREMEEQTARRRQAEIKAHTSDKARRNNDADEYDIASEIEVASLRAQVAQLQFALKKQMSGYGGLAAADLTGLPTPEQSYSGSVNGNFRVTRSPSYNNSDSTHFYPRGSHAHDEHASMRSTAVPGRIVAGMPSPSSGRHDEISSYQSAAYRSDNASLLSSVHNTSVTNRSDGDMRVEEIAAKLAHLEEMFRMVSTSPTGLPVPAPATVDEQRVGMRRHEPGSHLHVQTRSAQTMMRSDSSADSMYGQSVGRQSPASSVFVYNATSPYNRAPGGANESTATNSTLSVGKAGQQEDGVKVKPVMRKGVSRFLLGSTAKLADANGDTVPSVQVSFSRKRSDRIEKPTAKIKAVSRGRVAIVYDK